MRRPKAHRIAPELPNHGRAGRLQQVDKCRHREVVGNVQDLAGQASAEAKRIETARAYEATARHCRRLRDFGLGVLRAEMAQAGEGE